MPVFKKGAEGGGAPGGRIKRGWLAGFALLVLVALAACRGGQEMDEDLMKSRDHMVEHDLKGRGIRDPAVLLAMREVPRHLFVPEELRDLAFADSPLPIGGGQTISQPYMVAAMTELLEPEPGDVVFEVGTGSGYQAAVLARIVKAVYTVEIVPELGATAAERLERLGVDNVSVRVGDGYAGWPEHAPFDGILVTCGAEDIPPPLINQLKPGARMIIPVGPHDRVQELVVVEKEADGRMTRRTVMPVRFVPMTGTAMEK